MTFGRLLIRAHGSPHAGAGHVMRCLALAEEWIGNGGQASFCVGPGIGPLTARIEETGAGLIGIDAAPGSAADAALTSRAAREANAAALVLDGYVFDESYTAALQPDAPLLMVDDDARWSRYPAQLLLNQNLFASEAMYAGRAAGTRLLLGSDYALIRREIREAGTADHASRRDGPTRVLVTLGGADPANVTRTATEALRGLTGLDVAARVVVGPLFQGLDEIRALAADSGHLEVHVAPPDFPSLMAWADFAISAAGSTTWELMHLGIPLLLMVLADNQREIAASAARAGVAQVLGWHEDLDADAVGHAVAELAADPARRAAMSAAGRRLIDGHGAGRVAQAVRAVVAAGVAP